MFAVALLLGSTAAGACSGSAAQDGATPAAAPAAHRAAHRPRAESVLQATWTGYQLPAGITGAAAIARRGMLLIAGGAGPHGRLLRSVVRLDPLTGREEPAGRLTRPAADAAAALIGGRPLMFGGRSTHAIPAIQAIARADTGATGRALTTMIGRLPEARAGLAAVAVGNTEYLVGGINRDGPVAHVLSTTDGRRFSVAATLPVPVSYPAVAASDGALWVFGGVTSAGLSPVVQRIDLRSGHAAVAGRLPWPLAAGSALVIGGRIFLAGGLTTAASPQGGSRPAGPAGPATVSQVILSFAPATGATGRAGLLPMPVAHAAAAVVNGVGYLIGGSDGSRPVPAVTMLRLVPRTSAVPAGITATGAIGPSAGAPSAADAPGSRTPWLAPVSRAGHLARGSDPSALPADVLVADHGNNRLVIVDARGRVRWVFPRPGDLRSGQSFLAPDDAFFSPDGRHIVVTQEDDQVISVINVAKHKIVYRYGKPGTPGSGPGRLDNPDDAMMMPNGDIIAADIKNCRIVLIRPPGHHLLRVIGTTTTVCAHAPPGRLGSPNGAFPMAGGYVVTEINGDWADGMTLAGHVLWSVHPPGVLYPSDTNEVLPGRYLTADFSNPGQVVEFSAHGRLLWRFGGLNHPSLALPLPNGDVLVNDDLNDRIIVIDPRKNRIVWQYGHSGIPGGGPGYLNDPDGLDLVPPDSFLIRHAPTMSQP